MHVLECSAAPDWLRAPAKFAHAMQQRGKHCRALSSDTTRTVAGKLAGLTLTAASRCRDMTSEPRDLEFTDYDKGEPSSLCGLLKEIASL